MSNRHQQAIAQRATLKAYPSERLVATTAFSENGISRALEALTTPKPKKAKRPITIRHFSFEGLS